MRNCESGYRYLDDEEIIIDGDETETSWANEWWVKHKRRIGMKAGELTTVSLEKWYTRRKIK
jgi:hypothetical protein